jgi:hypothetical protein
MPGWIRLVLAVLAAAGIGVGVAMFVTPAQTAEIFWSWPLTALTARAVGAWLVGVGVAAGHVAWEGDWQRARAASIAFVLFGLLQFGVLARFGLGGAAAYEGPLIDWGNWRIWAYVFFVGLLLVAGISGWWAASRSET